MVAPAAPRFWAKVDQNGPVPEQRPDLGPCWLWLAYRDPKGYGRFKVDHTQRSAHSFAYELARGPVPEGFQLDHLCRTPPCVRPTHLEAVTHAENTRRGWPATKTHCTNGHLFDDANTYRRPNGQRDCRACIRARAAAYKQRKGSAA